MSDKPDKLPDAAAGLGGESDVVAERSGCDTPRARRPIPADPPEDMDEREPEEDPGGSEDEIRPDIGPTGFAS